MYFWDKHKTGAQLASIVHYHDGILYHSDVHLEIYLPGSFHTGMDRSPCMDIGNCQNCDMSVPPE